MIRSIPNVQTNDRNLNQLQQNIVSAVNPIIANPITNGHIVSSVSLVTGTNSVNHLLNRPLIGWFIVRQRALASVYDLQDTNSTPDVTLSLVSSADVVVDLYVF